VKKRGLVNPGGTIVVVHPHAAGKSHKKPRKKKMPAKQYAEYIKWLNEHHFTRKQRKEFDRKKLEREKLKRERQKKKRAEERNRRVVQAAGGDLMAKRRGISTVRVGPPAPQYAISPTQYGAYLKHLNSVQYTHAQRAAYNRKTSAGQRPQPTRRTVALAAPALPGEWILGGNDRYTDCAAAAVANSLLACTGLRASDEDILRLHLAAAGDPDAGASIAGVLRAATDLGLAGAGPASCELLGEDEPLDEDGLILDLDLAEAQLLEGTWDWDPAPGWGMHAAVLTGGSVITWGGAVPVTAEFLEFQVAAAWRVTWEAPSRL
jgi:hypothetical protein